MSRLTRYDKLEERLKGLGSVVVAFSGGTDSAFLLRAAKEVLGGQVLAVIVASELVPLREVDSAVNLAQSIKVPHKILNIKFLGNVHLKTNGRKRCYFCKKMMFARLKKVSRSAGFAHVIEGSNADDLLDERPGALALKELGIISPLQEVGFKKKDIRRLSRELGVAVWNKPALSCLATRIPHGVRLSRKKLMRIDKAEELLRQAFRIKGDLRVRDFGTQALIEAGLNQIRPLIKNLPKLRDRFGILGYKDVFVDPKGYQRGRMNEVLERGKTSLFKRGKEYNKRYS